MMKTPNVDRVIYALTNRRPGFPRVKGRTVLPPTPVTPKGLEKYDHLPPFEAALRAWRDEGNHPQWHRQQREHVRNSMPLLGRALDRA